MYYTFWKDEFCFTLSYCRSWLRYIKCMNENTPLAELTFCSRIKYGSKKLYNHSTTITKYPNSLVAGYIPPLQRYITLRRNETPSQWSRKRRKRLYISVYSWEYFRRNHCLLYLKQKRMKSWMSYCLCFSDCLCYNNFTFSRYVGPFSERGYAGR